MRGSRIAHHRVAVRLSSMNTPLPQLGRYMILSRIVEKLALVVLWLTLAVLDVRPAPATDV